LNLQQTQTTFVLLKHVSSYSVSRWRNRLPDIEGDAPVVKVDDAGNVVVDLPPVSEEKAAARKAFAEKALDFATALGTDEATTASLVDAYVKGGPLWLYYGNRDFVVALPDHIKAAMIQDVSEQSGREAQQMGRDILKDPSTGLDAETWQERTPGI
jgi:hypothetical protein